MNEQDAKLYKLPGLLGSLQNAKFDRRTALKVTGAFMLADLGLLSLSSCTAAPEKIKRTEGEWSKKEIEDLALEMIKETQLRDVPYAGYMLLKNLQGEPILSQNSPLFTDDPIRVTTYKDLPPSPLPEALGPAEAEIKLAGEKFNFVLKGKKSNKEINLFQQEKLRLDEIKISKNLTKDYSNFLIKFIMAKEVYNLKAFDEASTRILAFANFPEFEFPQDERAQKALRVRVMINPSSIIDGIPVGMICDIWAHFFMVPDYARAKELGKFTSRDLDDFDNIFGGATRFFKDRGILVKNNERYEWRMNAETQFRVWMEATRMIYTAFMKPKEAKSLT